MAKKQEDPVKLSAKVIIERDKGHFTEDEGVTELPIALNYILDIINKK